MISRPTRRPWETEAFWLAAALLLRVAFALKLGTRFHQTDELGWDAAARQLAATGVLGAGGRALVMPPLPPAFFALFYQLGASALLPRLGQALAATAAAWGVGRMTRDLTGSERAGRLALAVAAVYPFFVYYSGMLMSETLYVLLTVLGFWQLGLSLRARSVRRAAAAGLALGLAALARPEAAPIVAVIWAVAALACLAGRWSGRAWAAAALCWAVPLGAWCARNQAVTGRFSLDDHGGITMLHGTVALEQNEIDTAEAMKALEALPWYQAAQALPPAERDREYLRRALAFTLEDPTRTLRQWGRKLVNFWRFYPRLDKRYAEAFYSRPGAGLSRGTLTAVSLLFEPALILGGFWGLWRLRARWLELAPLVLFLLGTMGVHVLSVSQMRYRLPVMPALILGFAFAVTRKNPGVQSQKR